MNKTLLTVAATAGLAIGGLSATQIAAAQYGDDTPTEAPTAEVDSAEVDSLELLPIQDGTEDEAPGDAENGERRGRRGHRGGGCNLDAAAEAIGIDVDELRTSLDAGQSIADVATANDVDPDSVVDALVEDAAERLAQKVGDGRLTQEESDERLAEKTERITDRVFDTPGDDDAVA